MIIFFMRRQPPLLAPGRRRRGGKPPPVSPADAHVDGGRAGIATMIAFRIPPSFREADIFALRASNEIG
jgi:hypothetical protein